MEVLPAIRRVCARNFLSLRDACIDLGKLNILIGPNASGKSNIATVFRLIQSISLHGAPSLEDYRFESIFYAMDVTKVVEVNVELENGYRYKLELYGEGSYREEVTSPKGETIYEYDGKSGYFKYINVRSEVRKGYLNLVKMNFKDGSYDVYRSMLSLKPVPHDVSDDFKTVVRVLAGISIYKPYPYTLKARDRVEMEPRLWYDGRGLARFLLHLYLERRRDFQRVEEAIRSLVPEVEELIPHLERGEVELWIRVRGLDAPLRPENISDGTLRLLAIVTALYSGDRLVVFEEPENHIHPHLLEALVDMARGSPSQVVVTTHSTHILDYVEPGEVYLVYKDGLETKVRRLTESSSIDEVRRFLEEGGTLGEAWYSGVMRP
jgi:energy-coupling factor transporter ATP-binding protein EcfA2